MHNLTTQMIFWYMIEHLDLQVYIGSALLIKIIAHKLCFIYCILK